LECRLICRTASRILGLKLMLPIGALRQYQVCLLLRRPTSQHVHGHGESWRVSGSSSRGLGPSLGERC
jgi:hypothetical protein